MMRLQISGPSIPAEIIREMTAAAAAYIAAQHHTIEECWQAHVAKHNHRPHDAEAAATWARAERHAFTVPGNADQRFGTPTHTLRAR